MKKMGNFDCRDFKDLQKQLEKLQGTQDKFVESCAKELAARLLRMVVKRTPVGDYPQSTGKKGGTLRRGWISQKGSGSEGLNTRGVAQFVDTIKVNHLGDTYVIDVINPVEYASYVEYGHRTADHRGWVKGHFMMTISEQELERIAPRALENRIRKYLGGCLK